MGPMFSSSIDSDNFNNRYDTPKGHKTGRVDIDDVSNRQHILQVLFIVTIKSVPDLSLCSSIHNERP